MPTSFPGRVSRDSFGRPLAEQLARDGVHDQNLVAAAENTTLAVVSLSGGNPPATSLPSSALDAGQRVMSRSVWIAQVTIDTPRPLDEECLVALAQAAEETRDGSVARRSDGPGYVVIVGVEDEDPVVAAQVSARFARDGLSVDPARTVVDLRVTTPERFEAEALRPDFPPLASAADVAEMLGVSRQRVHQLAASNTRFPAPVARVATGPLWAVPAVEHFARVWDRRPGRRHDAATARPLRPGDDNSPRRR